MSSTSESIQQPQPAAIAAERRPQAEPLPSKRGEIGYIEGVHVPLERADDAGLARLPERHPADRDNSPPSAPPLDTGSAANPSPSSSESPSSPSSITKSPKGLKSLTFGGLQFITLLIFTIQLFIFAGTIVGWVFAARLMMRTSSSGDSNSPSGQSTSVFVHVVFVLALLGQLIYLERRLFRLRGERYSYLHPGEILPRHRNIPRSPDTALAFAPWNRPPLPTYAAALAQSGVGTGDVEDHIIAVSPPPAYGNTRGSTLLLAGYLRNSLRAQRPNSSYSQAPPESPDRTPSRLSYVSRGEAREGRENADRAQRLEATLSRLESTPQTSTPRQQ
ncbi:hypothetical protein JR316_0007204 [Psilocybe cubensis]|uniref:Uncharacterized protein n=2 Tax=Psilocybe cubensis TaxID=181762 RepID=A0A8H7XR43_PSICU|nr:hypothetical protein JR316_0007204 [Psilocybe cubensis]KAH9480604.1 hypothetical protein JR316_0007204 [Psilocybe cubensis]